MTTKPARRERNHIAKVEANLREIYRTAKLYSRPDADVTPTEMHLIMVSAVRAMRALGWELKAD